MSLAEATPLYEQALAYPDQARSLVISDSRTYEQACDFLKGVKALRQRIAEVFGPHIKRAFEAHRALCGEQREHEAPLLEAERVVKDALVAYDREQERIQREAQQRQLAEQRRLEEERRLQEALALEARGRHEQAEAVLEKPIVVPVPVLPAREVPKVAGVAFRETYSARCTDLHALIRHVAAHPEHTNLLVPNQAAINAMARSLRQQLLIPGVEVVATRDVAAARR